MLLISKTSKTVDSTTKSTQFSRNNDETTQSWISYILENETVNTIHLAVYTF